MTRTKKQNGGGHGPLNAVHRRIFGGGREADRGLIVKSGLLPNTEPEVAALMFEDDESKRERAAVIRTIVVQAVAGIKAKLAARRHADDERRAEVERELSVTFGRMIDGSRFRTAWDLGDAPEINIMAAVAKTGLGDLADVALKGHHEVTAESIERDAALLLSDVEAKHGGVVVVVDARQGRLL